MIDQWDDYDKVKKKEIERGVVKKERVWKREKREKENSR